MTSLVTSLLHFYQSKLFKNIVCILSLFGLFWLLFKKLGDFFTKHLVTLLGHDEACEDNTLKPVPSLQNFFSSSLTVGGGGIS